MAGLTGKVAIVTGGSRGIGAGIARRLAADGASVVVGYVQREEAALQVVRQIEQSGGEAMALQADMGDLRAVERLFAATMERFHRLDILVNNAAVAECLPLSSLDAEHFERMFHVNVRGPLFAMQQAALYFHGPGCRIINLSSGITQVPAPMAPIYAATKAALENLTRSIAHDLGPRGVTVNAVAPGATASDMLDAFMSEEQKRQVIASTPLGRLGTPEDIAAVVAFLASEEGGWITGQVIYAGGGLR